MRTILNRVRKNFSHRKNIIKISLLLFLVAVVSASVVFMKPNGDKDSDLRVIAAYPGDPCSGCGAPKICSTSSSGVVSGSCSGWNNSRCEYNSSMVCEEVHDNNCDAYGSWSYSSGTTTNPGCTACQTGGAVIGSGSCQTCGNSPITVYSACVNPSCSGGNSCYTPYTGGQTSCSGFNQVVGTNYRTYSGPGTGTCGCGGSTANLCCTYSDSPCTFSDATYSISITSAAQCGANTTFSQINSTNCGSSVKAGKCIPWPVCSGTCSASCVAYQITGVNCIPVDCPSTTTCNSCQMCSGTSPGTCVADASKNVNGGWGSWGSWGSCSVSCGGGTQSHSRSCNNPSPACAGSSCSGSSSESQACNTGCCPVAGGWSGWGSCSVSCGDGTQSRTCTNPSPSCGGATCSGSSSQSCNLGCCPVSGTNGSCGSANGVATGVPPASNLCNVGSNSSVTTGALSYTWTCYGTAGSCGGASGSDANCSAPRMQTPSYTGFELRNNVNTVVAAESGNINHVCQTVFTGRLVRYVVTATDPNGVTDITSVQLRVGGQTYTNNYASNFTGTAIFDVTYPAVVSSTTTIIETNITDSSALSTGWVNVGRSFKIWDCKVPVSGTLYDGSKAVFEVINCGAGSSDFATPVSSSMAYGLTFTGIALDTDKAMSVGSPNYNSGANSLYWGAQYRANFTNVDGNTPVMRYPGNNTCNSTNASFTVDNSGQIAVNPYAASPTLTLNFSSILSQFPWFQAAGGGVVAKNSITDNIPNTCVDPCKPSISLSAGTTAPNGLVAAQTITKGSGSFGETNNWSVNKNVIGTDYSYKYFYNEYYAKLGQGKAYDVGTSSINFSQIISDTGGTGVVFVKGSVNVNTNNTVPAGTFFMLVASIDININPSVTSMQGIFITDNNFATTGTSDSQLRIDGSVYSKNNVRFARGFTTGTFNNRNPAVLVNYRPDFIFSMPGKLTKILSGWREGI